MTIRKTDKKILAMIVGGGILAIILIIGFMGRQSPLVQPPAGIEPAAGLPLPTPTTTTAPVPMTATTNSIPNPALVATPIAPVTKPVQVQAATTVPAQPNAGTLVITADDQEIAQQLKKEIASQFAGKLNFPLDETKMLAFVQLANKVKKINNRWDVLVASAETDKMAIEYNNLAISEITNSLKSNPNLTLDQYNDLTKLSATDTEFNKIYLAYRDMVAAKPKTAIPIPSPNIGSIPVIVNGQVAPASQPAPASYGQPLPAVGQPTVPLQPMPSNRQNGTGQPIATTPSVAGAPSTSPAATQASPGNTLGPRG